MQVWSHRGCVDGGRVENTLDAFDHAIALGATGIELDVRLCGSGEPIVMHDSTLWRTDGKFIPTCITSLKDLREKCSYHIPTLAEVLGKYGDKCRLILDLKGTRLRDSQLERKVVEEVQQASKPVIISCTEPVSLCKVAALRSKSSRIELALIAEGWLSLSRISPIFISLDAVHFSDKLASKSRIKFWKRQGLKVRVWTVNEDNRAIELANSGVHGMITDNEQLLG